MEQKNKLIKKRFTNIEDSLVMARGEGAREAGRKPWSVMPEPAGLRRTAPEMGSDD